MNKYKDKKILITGAAGFVGSNAVKYFFAKGAHIRACVSPETSDDVMRRQLGESIKGIEVVKVDLLNPDKANDVYAGCNIVLNFAAIDGSLEFKKNNSAEIISKNLRLNLNALDSAVKNNIEFFLLVSSSDIYSQTESGMIDEKSEIEMNYNNTIDGYKLSKWVSELAAREYRKQYNLNVAIIRPGNLYGPGDDFEDGGKSRFIPTCINKIYKDNEPICIWGDGSQVRSFMYVEDFISAIDKIILGKHPTEPINIAGKNNFTLKDVAQTILKIAGRDVNMVKYDTSKPTGVKKRIFNLQNLENYIGDLEETVLEEGLRNTIGFYKLHYL